MGEPREILRGFVEEARHLTSKLNLIASDMIRDRELVEKLKSDPDYFSRKYAISEIELKALREHDIRKLFELGLHPFLVVRFAGMVGILEYWTALGAPGRDNCTGQLE